LRRSSEAFGCFFGRSLLVFGCQKSPFKSGKEEKKAGGPKRGGAGAKKAAREPNHFLVRLLPAHTRLSLLPVAAAAVDGSFLPQQVPLVLGLRPRPYIRLTPRLRASVRLQRTYSLLSEDERKKMIVSHLASSGVHLDDSVLLSSSSFRSVVRPDNAAFGVCLSIRSVLRARAPSRCRSIRTTLAALALALAPAPAPDLALGRVLGQVQAPARALAGLVWVWAWAV
jgi:hypothetical protein